MKITFLDAMTLGDTPLDCISSLGELTSWPLSSRAEALERVSDCEVLIVNKVTVDKALIDAAPCLKLICESATGTNNIDIEYAASKGIAVRNVAAYSTDSVAQQAFMHMLSLMGDAPYFDGRVKDGTYSAMSTFNDPSKPFMEAAGKTIGIIGMGAIGFKVAAIATAFGMKVVYYSTSGTSHCTEYPSLSLDEILSTSDVISIHAPMNDRTRGMIGKAELARMKPTSYLLNLGRGGIVDEAALAEAVDRGVIAGAALDVFCEEPLPADNPLLNVAHPERFRFSPHNAWASAEARLRLAEGVARNIREYYLCDE